MVDLLTTDVIFAVALIVVATIAIYAFIRATKIGDKKEKTEDKTLEKSTEPTKIDVNLKENRVTLPPIERKLPLNDIEKAKSNIRTLTLKQEITSMVLRRLFEAEDEGEITKEERIRLSSTYEEEIKKGAEELKQSELVVSLAELETIREDIIKKFEATLNQTQEKIDIIIKELKIEEPPKIVEEEPKQKTLTASKKRRIIPKTKANDESIEALEDIEEINGVQEIVEGQAANNEVKQPEVKMDVEARLNKLKQEVLKELDELDKLELEG